MLYEVITLLLGLPELHPHLEQGLLGHLALGDVDVQAFDVEELSVVVA